MRICVIGDPHGDLNKIKRIPLSDVDLILITGDLGRADLMRKMTFDNVERIKQGLAEIKYPSSKEKKAFMEAYNSTIKIVNYLRKFAPVFTIFGNVELSNYETRKLSNKIGISLPYLSNELNKLPNVRVINNRIASFGGVKIGGLKYFVDTNWVKDFKPYNYKSELIKAKKETSKAKQVLKWFGSLDILICHQPPYGILDKVTAKFAPKQWRGKHAGSKAILEYIKSKSPKYVFCGHIHEGEGVRKVCRTKVYNLGFGGYKIVNF